MSILSTGFMTDSAWTATLASKLDKVDCSQVLAAVLKGDREILGHIKMGPPAHNIMCDWIEDGLNPASFEAYSSEVSTTLTFITSFSSQASGKAMIRDGSILAPVDPRGGTDYLVQVTSVLGTAGVKLAGAYGSTTWVTAGLTTTWHVVASPYSDDDDASSDASVARTKRSNLMQVFERAVSITQTRKGMDMEAVVSELQLQIKRRTMEIKRELALSVTQGISQTGVIYTDAASELMTMTGIINRLRDPDYDATREDTMVTARSGNALVLSDINDLAYKIYDAGGLDDSADPIIVVGPKQQRVIAAMENGIRRAEPGERKVGYYKDVLITDMGVEMPVVLDRWFPAGMLMIMDRSRVALRPLAGDSWHLEKMAKTGRHEKWQISGQYTLEIRNADAAHGLLVDVG
ncbi:DUF5309 family protein [Neptuniibacter sp.]|uniref:SU10 major capsid protein n=1 Tax=Neptuniibacter sp. TaxID=1962643 RepID=UPI002622C34C|nr:DUF5309 family protein [Neptuniibacter sp.]MCP4597067.1 DUF5309 domain-containing protein [Neptuniibacter sp.]